MLTQTRQLKTPFSFPDIETVRQYLDQDGLASWYGYSSDSRYQETLEGFVRPLAMESNPQEPDAVVLPGTGLGGDFNWFVYYRAHEGRYLLAAHDELIQDCFAAVQVYFSRMLVWMYRDN